MKKILTVAWIKLAVRAGSVESFTFRLRNFIALIFTYFNMGFGIFLTNFDDIIE